MSPSPLPGCCASCSLRMAMVTSWAFTFFDEWEIGGCQQIIHLPFCDVNMLPFDVCVVYKPRKGELACVFFVRNVDSAGLQAECPVGRLIESAEQVHASKAAVNNAKGAGGAPLIC